MAYQLIRSQNYSKIRGDIKSQILIDGKPLEETIWQVGDKFIQGDKALSIIALGSPLFPPIILGSGLLGFLIGKRVK